MISAQDLAGRLALRKYRRSWRGDCPACSYHGAFSLRGDGDKVLVHCSNGCDREALADAISRVAGGDWQRPEPETQSDADKKRKRQEAALRLWSSSISAPDTLVDRYLAGRGLPGLAASAALRFRQDVHHPEGGRLPAMVAAVMDAGGVIIAAHRTFLSAETGGKASVTPNKASLGPVWGGAIRLDPVAPELVIGEGIESSASAGRLLHLPAWAAISAGNLEKGLVLPPAVRSVVIAADRDLPGQRAAWAAAERWRAEGRTVRVALPDEHPDFNDLLRARQPAQEAVHA
ncbi:DUF7146 domain-containing protein [Teichococcus aerofrigidensis]